MKLKLTNREVVALSNTLTELNYRGVKFAYTVARNLNSLKPIIKSMDAALKIPKEFTEYEKARVALGKEHADKDAAGNPKVEGSHFIISNMAKFDAELATLQGKHKAAIDARQTQLDEYAKLQDDEVEVELFPIAQNLLPNDISTKELNDMFVLIQAEEGIESPLSDEFTGKKPKTGA